ncbi:TolC family protein [Niveispirillum sp. KHB5.9]|uniref:TolC family protein n=1 Tax=Niveispirillum sp. KHB5.9 TaxID=3400269 RepID=UPI003A88CCC0
MRLHYAVALAISIAGAPAAWAQTAPAAAPSLLETTSLLTPETAIARALESAPRGLAARARLDAAGGAVTQADTSPNPEVGFELENFSGSGPYKDFRSSERTYSLSQTVELGGKRGRRTQAARAARDVAAADLDLARLDLTRDVRLAFSEAVAASRQVELARDGLRLAVAVEDAIKARVEAGREAPIQANRADIARRQAQLEVDKAGRRQTAARQVLAGLTGLDPAGLQLDEGWFSRIDGVEPQAAGEAPDLRRLQAEAARGRAELSVEQAKLVPDVTLSAGFRQFKEDGENAFLVGVSVPIPIFDSNRGGIAKARADLVAAEADLAAERIDLERRLTAARFNLAAARDTATSLRDSIIPTAEQAFALANEGYGQGKFSYLEVLEAQRTLVEARTDLINAFQGFHDARAELERLTAQGAEVTK